MRQVPSRMQWFILIVFAFCLLASLGFSIGALILTKSIVPIVIPAPLLLSMRPIIRYAFPLESQQSKEQDA